MSPFADIILHNGRIRTQDDRHPFAEAVAVSDKKILSVGTDKDVLTLKSPGTRVINLEGRLMLPGFADTHFHFYEWALNYDSIDFSRTAAFRDMLEILAEKAQALGKEKWVLGQGFNESDWPDGRMPDRHDLDTVCPDNPVCIWRCDMHLAVANSMALEHAGIHTESNDPPGSVIVRDGAGHPTGVLKELAPNLIRKVLPQTGEAVVLENMLKAVKDIHKLGLTSIHDTRLMGGIDGADALKAWQMLQRENTLLIRCHVVLPGEMADRAIDLGLMTGFGDDLLKIGYLKFFSDGGMGARTAWMTEKYLDAGYGMPLTAMSHIEKTVKKADRAGLSVMIHAIGDRANKEVVRMFERLETQQQSRCRIPHRIEHVQMILPEDVDRLALLENVAVSCQPNNLSLDISMVEASVGDRSKHAYPLKSILQTGIPMMLSSDAPVSDPNPMSGIYSAVTRRRMDFTPKKGWHMEQAIGIDDAVKGYTINPAKATKTDDVLGSVTPGKFADMVVLNRDIYTVDPGEIAGASADITIFNGQIVHER